MPYIGSSVLRLEDALLLTGKGRYVDDVVRPGMLHAAVLRSTYAHARIKSIDVSEALKIPGVHAIFTHADLKDEMKAPIPVRLAPLESLTKCLQYPLAGEKVRYVGEPVAVVVAASRYQAEDALPFIEVDYDPLPPHSTMESAMGAEAALLHAVIGTNVVAEFTIQRGDVQSGLAAADFVLEESFYVQRHGAIPMETRGLVAEWDEERQHLTMWGPTKVVHFNRRVLSTLTGLPAEQITFIEPHVGGGFGARGEFYPEDFLVPVLAMKLKRPIKWIEDRLEHFKSTNHSREQRQDVTVGYNRDGKIVALKSTLYSDQGGYVRTHGVTVPNECITSIPGPYDIPHYRCDVKCVLTNKVPQGTYRAPGFFEATFVRERLCDMIASRLGLDAAEVRRINLIRPEQMPYDGQIVSFAGPTIFDSGDYPDTLAKCLKSFDYEGWRKYQEEARAEGRLVGIGIAAFAEPTGLGPYEYGRVEMNADGSLTIYTGSAELGQGIGTALAQVVADTLCVPIERIAIVHGDTSRVPDGIGSFASRGTMLSGSAIQMAAERLLSKLRQIAAHVLEAPEGDLVFAQGSIAVTGAPERSVSLDQIAALVHSGGSLPEGLEPKLAEEARCQFEGRAHTFGVNLCALEVDPETGEFHILKYLIGIDVGRAINPMIVHGQIVGGFSQGLGGTILEDLVYDEEGQLLAGSFMDYLLPTAMDVPEVDVLLLEEHLTPVNPLGVKGVGEGGTVGVPGAVPNAVMDELRPLGPIDITRLPVTPQRVLALIRGESV